MSARMPNPKLCVKCGRRGKVDDSRRLPSIGAQRRHHVCKCGNDWNTYETSIHPDLLREAIEALTSGRTNITISTPGRTVVRKP